MNENPSRVEAFSDGVFAIAITLLILEIRVPHGDEGRSLWAGLLALWPSYVAFLMSFFVILIEWVNHHELLRMVRAVNYPFLFANGFLLLTVTFLPFPTAVLAAKLATPDAGAAVAFYCATFVLNALFWNVLFATMVRGRLLRTEVSENVVRNIRKTYYVSMAVYVLAAALAFVQPAFGLVLNASLWIVFVRLGYRSESVSSQS